jgi:hypothetical protein
MTIRHVIWGNSFLKNGENGANKIAGGYWCDLNQFFAAAGTN